MCMMPLAFFLGATVLEMYLVCYLKRFDVGATTTHRSTSVYPRRPAYRIAEGQFTGLISVSCHGSCTCLSPSANKSTCSVAPATCNLISRRAKHSPRLVYRLNHSIRSHEEQRRN
ncbi:hypothetical protein EV401DRAFT_113949 [Pisolithus croceorrhizus]|nr:hypothetical protein EV401DRAFT_113949 [Pisolithus croceorrhizus]